MTKKQPKNKAEEIKLPPFVVDDIHYDSREIDGKNKAFNFVISPREPGKSTRLWKKAYDAFRKEKRPSIYIKRWASDFSEGMVNDFANLIEKFTKFRPEFKFSKQDAQKGIMDLKINGKVFVRLVSLSAPMSRLKSACLPNLKYMFMDEFICNLRIGEKYLSDEPMRIKELYSTYYRETENLKCYFFGNPYSLYNPYFSWLNVDTRKLKVGTIITGDEYAIEVYELKQELKDYILSRNPLYKFDDSYKQYGFEGVAIQDTNIRIEPNQPRGFGLCYVFKLNNKLLGVYSGIDMDKSLFYWCKIINGEVSARRDIVTFDFGQMGNGTILCNNEYKKNMYYLKNCIEYRQIAYADIESSYFMEEIYQNL